MPELEWTILNQFSFLFRSSIFPSYMLLMMTPLLMLLQWTSLNNIEKRRRRKKNWKIQIHLIFSFDWSIRLNKKQWLNRNFCFFRFVFEMKIFCKCYTRKIFRKKEYVMICTSMQFFLFKNNIFLGIKSTDTEWKETLQFIQTQYYDLDYDICCTFFSPAPEYILHS